MKNKIKVLVVLIAYFIGLNTLEVEAISDLNIQGRFTGQINTGIKYNTDKQTGTYQDSRFEVKLHYKRADGSVYDATEQAYCIDVGYHMSLSFNKLQCQKIQNGALSYVLKEELTGNYNHTVIELALRMVAIATGEAKKLYEEGEAISAFIRDNTSLKSENDIGAEELRQARDLYQRAMQHISSDYVGSGGNHTGNKANKLKFTEREAASSADGESYTAIYDVETVDGNDIGNVKFSCEDCTIEDSSWNGKKGTIKVHVNKPKCKFVIKAKYKDDGSNGKPGDPGYPGIPGVPGGPGDNNQSGDDNLYLCWYGTSQQLLINIDESVASDIGNQPGIDPIPGTDGRDPSDGDDGEATQSYTGTVSSDVSGLYYEKYCKNQCNPDEDGTKINIPQYCDDANGETMTITGPEKISACVLNGQDEAGHSYRDTNIVDVNNPYCAVYCKEDYTMNLPGATFTNSGSHFSLNRTKVTGTRTCYITGNDEKKEGIDFDKYKADIEQAQRDLVTAYNEYISKKALYDNIDKATPTVSECGGNKYTKYDLSVEYTPYNISCSSSTGECKTSTGSKTTVSATWGTSISKDVKNPSSTTVDGYNCTLYGDDNANKGKYYCEKCGNEVNHGSAPSAPNDSKINAARNRLNNAIANIKKCYNWEMNFQFDPDVKFDYNEEYSTNINYAPVVTEETDDHGVKIEGSSEESGETIDPYYNVSGGAPNTNNSYLNCTTSGCTTNAIVADGISPSIKFIKKSQTKSAEYENKQAFQTNYPHGTIDTVDDPSQLKYNYSYLGAVFPVALNTKAGVYNWTLKFDKIGQCADSRTCNNSLGRLNDVAQKKFNISLDNTLGYVCVYVVDCDDCDYGCVCPENLPDNFTCVQQNKFVCEITSVDCPECEPYCIDCVYNGNDTFTYRTVSLNNVNPNNRKMGSNWTNVKGDLALEAIDGSKNNGLGENAYTKLEYSYTISPSQMKEIRDYNTTNKTYANIDLKYHDMTDTDNNTIYKNFYGKSIFLDANDGKLFTENLRNTTWEIYKKGDSNKDGLGPAWK